MSKTLFGTGMSGKERSSPQNTGPCLKDLTGLGELPVSLVEEAVVPEAAEGAVAECAQVWAEAICRGVKCNPADECGPHICP